MLAKRTRVGETGKPIRHRGMPVYHAPLSDRYALVAASSAPHRQWESRTGYSGTSLSSGEPMRTAELLPNHGYQWSARYSVKPGPN